MSENSPLLGAPVSPQIPARYRARIGENADDQFYEDSPASESMLVDEENTPSKYGTELIASSEASSDVEVLEIDYSLPFLKRHFPRVRVWSFLAGWVVLVGVILLPIMKDAPEAHRCLALLLQVSIWWTFESVPIYVTAIYVPLPVVVGHILLDANGAPMPASAAATQIAYQFMDPVVFLFLGGFTIAAALGKYRINQWLASHVLAQAGTNPKYIMLAMMYLGVFLSMWISNVAAAVLCVSVILPVIRNMPEGETYPKAVLLGIAFACNVGGMTTPIASPQNAIALHAILAATDNKETVSFMQWLAFAVPFCVVLTLVIFGYLWLALRPAVVGIRQKKRRKVVFGVRQYFIIVVTVITVGLWCAEKALEDWVGSIGMVALLPVVVFFGTGLLTTSDFDTLAWSVLMLMGGGIALGYAIQTSNLLEIIASSIASFVGEQSVWVITLTFVTLIGIVGNFISSTVAAVIVLPVVAQVGVSIDHSRLLVTTAALMCSGAMGLPVSSFPNANSFAALNRRGERILDAVDYAKTGFPIGVICLALVMSFQYVIVYALGF